MSAREEVDALIALRDSGQLSQERFERSVALINAREADEQVRVADTYRGGDPTFPRAHGSSGPALDRSRSVLVAVFLVVCGLVLVAAVAGVVTYYLGSSTHVADAAACFSEGDTITGAVATFDVAHSPDTIVAETGIVTGDPSTYALGTQARRLVDSGSLVAWPETTEGYAFSLSTTQAGHVIVYVPPDARVGVDFSAETSSSGCNALGSP